jgi:hypothetical protein
MTGIRDNVFMAMHCSSDIKLLSAQCR